MKQVDVVKQTIIQFCKEFIENPYLCYTEHGQHAFFYTMLYNTFPIKQRFTTWQGVRLCIIQKEYPTAGKLGRSRRQNWDIAIVQTPPKSQKKGSGSYDFLKLAAVVQFGLNTVLEHLAYDVESMSHQDANVKQGFAVNLYRLSKASSRLSHHDWSPKSSRIICKQKVAEEFRKKPVEIFYGMYDSSCQHENGLWLIGNGEITSV